MLSPHHICQHNEFIAKILLLIAQELKNAYAKASVNKRIHVILLSEAAVNVDLSEPFNLSCGTYFGFCQAFNLENSYLKAHLVDFNEACTIETSYLKILNEIEMIKDHAQISYRDNVSYKATIDHHPLNPSAVFSINESALYLVTGASKGIGFIISEWLIRLGAKHIIMLSRGAVSESKDRIIEQWKKHGVEVLLYYGDVADNCFLSSVFKKIDESHIPLKGIFHCAGVLRDALIENQNFNTIQDVFQPKVIGTWNLHNLSKDIDLDFFVFFWPIFGSRWPLFGPPWPSPGLPGLRFNSLDPRESGLDPVSANFRPKKFFATSEKSYLGVLPPKIDSYGLGTIIERSASKFCISGLRRRVKRTSWSNFMAMSIRFILQWRSRLHYDAKLAIVLIANLALGVCSKCS